MKKKKFTKRAINNLHFKKRIKQRYGVDLNSKQVTEMIKSIHTNKSRFIKKDTLTRSLHLINYMEKNFLVVYDGNQKNFVTALPLDKLEKIE